VGWDMLINSDTSRIEINLFSISITPFLPFSFLSYYIMFFGV